MTDFDKKANDAWIMAIPDDRYGPCPCGCGKKIKFIEKDPEPHFERFRAKMGEN